MDEPGSNNMVTIAMVHPKGRINFIGMRNNTANTDGFYAKTFPYSELLPIIFVLPEFLKNSYPITPLYPSASSS